MQKQVFTCLFMLWLPWKNDLSCPFIPSNEKQEYAHRGPQLWTQDTTCRSKWRFLVAEFSPVYIMWKLNKLNCSPSQYIPYHQGLGTWNRMSSEMCAHDWHISRIGLRQEDRMFTVLFTIVDISKDFSAIWWIHIKSILQWCPYMRVSNKNNI